MSTFFSQQKRDRTRRNSSATPEEIWLPANISRPTPVGTKASGDISQSNKVQLSSWINTKIQDGTIQTGNPFPLPTAANTFLSWDGVDYFWADGVTDNFVSGDLVANQDRVHSFSTYSVSIDSPNGIITLGDVFTTGSETSLTIDNQDDGDVVWTITGDGHYYINDIRFPTFTPAQSTFPAGTYIWAVNEDGSLAGFNGWLNLSTAINQDFAHNNLTFDADRQHDTNGFALDIIGYSRGTGFGNTHLKSGPSIIDLTYGGFGFTASGWTLRTAQMGIGYTNDSFKVVLENVNASGTSNITLDDNIQFTSPDGGAWNGWALPNQSQVAAFNSLNDYIWVQDGNTGTGYFTTLAAITSPTVPLTDVTVDNTSADLAAHLVSVSYTGLDNPYSESDVIILTVPGEAWIHTGSDNGDVTDFAILESPQSAASIRALFSSNSDELAYNATDGEFTFLPQFVNLAELGDVDSYPNNGSVYVLSELNGVLTWADVGSVTNDSNFSNTDLTFNDGDRTHNLNGTAFSMAGGTDLTLVFSNGVNIQSTNIELSGFNTSIYGPTFQAGLAPGNEVKFPVQRPTQPAIWQVDNTGNGSWTNLSTLTGASLYTGSGSVPSGTIATLADNLTFRRAYGIDGGMLKFGIFDTVNPLSLAGDFNFIGSHFKANNTFSGPEGIMGLRYRQVGSFPSFTDLYVPFMQFTPNTAPDYWASEIQLSETGLLITTGKVSSFLNYTMRVTDDEFQFTSNNGLYRISGASVPNTLPGAGSYLWQIDGITGDGSWVDVGSTGATPIDTFVELTDTPSSFTGQGGKYLRVADTQDSLEFAAPNNIFESDGVLTSNRELSGGGNPYGLVLNALNYFTVTSVNNQNLQSTGGGIILTADSFINLNAGTNININASNNVDIVGNVILPDTISFSTAPPLTSIASVLGLDGSNNLVRSAVADLSVNLYNSNGSITSTRQVTLNNNLTFTGTGNFTANTGNITLDAGSGQLDMDANTVFLTGDVGLTLNSTSGQVNITSSKGSDTTALVISANSATGGNILMSSTTGDINIIANQQLELSASSIRIPTIGSDNTNIKYVVRDNSTGILSAIDLDVTTLPSPPQTGIYFLNSVNSNLQWGTDALLYWDEAGSGNTSSLSGGENVAIVPDSGGLLMSSEIDTVRGLKAVELQPTNLAYPAEIVSGDYGAILGGQRNTVSANYGAIIGSYLSQVTAANAVVIAGDQSSATAQGAIMIGAGDNSGVDSIAVHSTNSGTHSLALFEGSNIADYSFTMRGHNEGAENFLFNVGFGSTSYTVPSTITKSIILGSTIATARYGTGQRLLLFDTAVDSAGILNASNTTSLNSFIDTLDGGSNYNFFAGSTGITVDTSSDRQSAIVCNDVTFDFGENNIALASNQATLKSNYGAVIASFNSISGPNSYNTVIASSNTQNSGTYSALIGATNGYGVAGATGLGVGAYTRLASSDPTICLGGGEAAQHNITCNSIVLSNTTVFAPTVAVINNSNFGGDDLYRYIEVVVIGCVTNVWGGSTSGLSVGDKFIYKNTYIDDDGTITAGTPELIASAPFSGISFDIISSNNLRGSGVTIDSTDEITFSATVKTYDLRY